MDEDAQAELAAYRHTIDNLDSAVIHMLAERFRCTKQVGELKSRHGMPPADPVREAEQLERMRALAVEAGLDPAFAEKLLRFILAEVIRHHEEISAESG